MTSPKRIFWIAGESSADLHAALVIRELKQREMPFDHFGIGGKNMQDQGFKPIYPFDIFAVMGFVEVLKHIFFFKKVIRKITDIFKKNPPDLVILVDYPGLNMRIAKIAKRFGLKVIYYISPQFWAWKHKRIFQLKKYTDQVAYILPFEGEYFKKEKVNSSFVGHPIAEEISFKLTKSEFSSKYDLPLKKKWLGFFPGSRETEVDRLLPEFYKAIQNFDPDKYVFLISQAKSLSNYKFPHGKTNDSIRIIPEDNYEMMAFCDLMAVTSGTATLESAYIGTPFIIVYKTSWLSYQIGKHFIKIDKIGLPNIIMKKIVLPELIQSQVTGRNIAKVMNRILNNEKKYNQIAEELKELHQLLGDKITSQEMAELIGGMIIE